MGCGVAATALGLGDVLHHHLRPLRSRRTQTEAQGSLFKNSNEGAVAAEVGRAVKVLNTPGRVINMDRAGLEIGVRAFTVDEAVVRRLIVGPSAQGGIATGRVAEASSSPDTLGQPRPDVGQNRQGRGRPSALLASEIIRHPNQPRSTRSVAERAAVSAGQREPRVRNEIGIAVEQPADLAPDPSVEACSCPALPFLVEVEVRPGLGAIVDIALQRKTLKDEAPTLTLEARTPQLGVATPLPTRSHRWRLWPAC